MAAVTSPSNKSTKVPVQPKWPLNWFVIGLVTLLIEFSLKYFAWLYRLEFPFLTVHNVVTFSVVYTENPFSAFSMMRHVPNWVNKSLLVSSFLLLAGVAIQQFRSPTTTKIVRRGLFCFVVGAIGNLVDRVLVGAVIDYVDFYFFWRDFDYSLAWNLSDLVINLGFAHILYNFLYENGIEEAEQVVPSTTGDKNEKKKN